MRDSSSHVHTERLIAFLQAAGGEVLERVDVLTISEARLLTDSNGTRGNKATSVTGDIC